MKKVSNSVQRYPLLTVGLIVVLAVTTIHGQLSSRFLEAKFAKMSQNIERAAFTSRCGIPPATRLTDSVVSFAGRLMSDGDFQRLSAHHQPGSVRYYYRLRLPADTTKGVLVNELPNCPLYREQFIY